MSDRTLQELETAAADAQKQLAAKKSAIAAGKELPQPPREASIVVDEPGAGFVIAPFVFLINSDLDPYGVALPASGVGEQIAPGGGNAYYNGTTCPTDAVSVWGATGTLVIGVTVEDWLWYALELSSVALLPVSLESEVLFSSVVVTVVGGNATTGAGCTTTSAGGEGT